MTETWVYDNTAPEHHLHLPGYNLCLQNRKSGMHGGVGLYINNTIKFKTLNDLYHPKLEVLWVHLRPARLPRGFPCIVAGTVYHRLYPNRASDATMIDYLLSSLTTIEGVYPGCGILLTGDFNQLNISRILTQFKLKQLVHTRGDGSAKNFYRSFLHLVFLIILWSYWNLNRRTSALPAVVVSSLIGTLALAVNVSLAGIWDP